MCEKMMTIGSAGSAPHIRETYSYWLCFPVLFILRQPYSPNGKSHLDHNASIDADFLKEVPLEAVEICKKFQGHIWHKNIKTTKQN
jgi:hypothetical protein